MPKKGVCEFIDEEGLILSDWEEIIYCYDWQGNLSWSYKAGELGFKVELNLFDVRKDYLVFNSGVNQSDQGEVVCLEKKTGKLVWKNTYPKLVDSAIILNNKYYIAVGNQMLVLDPFTGEELLSFIAEIPDQDETILWTDDILLYVIAAQSNELLAYSLDGQQLIKRYKIPSHPCINFRNIPKSHKQVNYLSLTFGLDTLAGVECGVLSWTSEEVLAGKPLEIEEKPPMAIITAGEEDGSQSYYVNVPCESIHEVIRFGEITAKKIAALRGRQLWENDETLNKKFNGNIILMIDPAVGKEYSNCLTTLTERCNSFCKTMDITAGNGKAPINVSWEFNE